MQNWIMPTDGTSDIYTSSCPYLGLGPQAPRTGNVMCAIIPYTAYPSPSYGYREYLQVKLTHPLIIGKKYYAEMYVSAADFATYGCNNIGMAFSDTQISTFDYGVIPFTPQIKSNNVITDIDNWVKISGTFTATTAARYLTIGNFNDDVSTSSTLLAIVPIIAGSYYYIDDVLVEYGCNPKDSSTSICKGNSITINYDKYIDSWSLASDPNTILSNTSTLIASPQITTSYIAHYTCGETSTFEVIVDTLPTLTLGKDTTICKGETIFFDATTQHARYLWQDGSTNPTYTIDKTGKYSIEISNGCGNFYDTLLVTVNKPAAFSFGTDTTICSGEIMTFNATTDGASYLWQDGSTNSVYTINDPGYYAVIIKNVCGTTNENITLNVCCAGAKIPNLITPNGDAMNETFNIDCYGHGDYELAIYNTWGSLIYHNTAYLNNWNGNDVSDGIYYYVIKFKNTSINNGWVQIIR
ncbi:gliding motility-associated C-terminal domain-containing protein [Cytophaga aurantiaca]|uniref:gliding motility-associated C-terminal domain-containing protein n=1 Tax=Cytophaga aurantiaca TaxID=29530 RepID=UPI0012FB2223|nr:gliding motility-associated C-terminal domain-containing protein [Cytophaga aurantiaca]